MNLQERAADVAKRLGLELAYTPEEKVALVMLEAGAEMLSHVDDSGEDGAAFVAFAKWVQLVVPTATRAHCSRLASRVSPNASPEWLVALNLDADAAALFSPVLVLACLVAMRTKTATRDDNAWRYLTRAATQLGLADALPTLHGWLKSEGALANDVEAMDLVDAFKSTNDLCRRVVQRLHEVAKDTAGSAPMAVVPMSTDARDRLLLLIGRLRPNFGILELPSKPLDDLEQYVSEDYYRVAVLGGFNRGKSSLINALLGEVDLLPVAFLPSTSALIAVRYGQEPLYQQGDNAQTLKKSNRETFLAQSARAAESHSAGTLAPVSVSSAKKTVVGVLGPSESPVPRWRVHIPSRYLREHRVELVDTPGISEDKHREILACNEAQIADAAIVVLDPEYMGDAHELDLICSLKSKIKHTFIVLNKGDKFTREQNTRSKSFLLERLHQQELDLPMSHVLVVSSKCAFGPDQTKEWTAALEHLQQHLRDNLLKNSGLNKALALSTKLGIFVSKQRAEMSVTKQTLVKRLEDFQRITGALSVSTQQLAEIGKTIARAKSRLNSPSALVDELTSDFKAWIKGSLPRELKGRQSSWKVDINPLTSPNDHSKAVAKLAADSAGSLIKDWLTTHGEARISKSIEALLNSVGGEFREIAEFVQSVRPAQSVASLQEEIRRATLDGMVDDARRHAAEVDSLGRSIGTAIASLVAAYIVADLVLFYALSAIASFVAWPLLVAGGLFGFLGGATWGKSKAEELIRDKICDEIVAKLTSQEALNSMSEKFVASAVNATNRLASSFEHSAMAQVREVEAVRAKQQRELDELRTSGDPEELVKQKLANIETAVKATNSMLDEIQGIASILAPARSA
ncbi:MAG: dynamin family protein [Deltaproteobacteria bacterium]|nr:dynamin family protein [Deltaproteobacteria bacterium]